MPNEFLDVREFTGRKHNTSPQVLLELLSALGPKDDTVETLRMRNNVKNISLPTTTNSEAANYINLLGQDKRNLQQADYKNSERFFQGSGLDASKPRVQADSSSIMPFVEALLMLLGGKTMLPTSKLGLGGLLGTIGLQAAAPKISEYSQKGFEAMAKNPPLLR